MVDDVEVDDVVHKMPQQEAWVTINCTQSTSKEHPRLVKTWASLMTYGEGK